MVLDTNILIAYLNGEPAVVDALCRWREEGRALLISSVSLAEVLALPALGPSDLRLVTRFLRTFLSIAFDDHVAEVAAGLSRAYRLKLPDAAIAATALIHAVPLVTRDRVFRRLAEVELVGM